MKPLYLNETSVEMRYALLIPIVYDIFTKEGKVFQECVKSYITREQPFLVDALKLFPEDNMIGIWSEHQQRSFKFSYSLHKKAGKEFLKHLDIAVCGEIDRQEDEMSKWQDHRAVILYNGKKREVQVGTKQGENTDEVWEQVKTDSAQAYAWVSSALTSAWHASNEEQHDATPHLD